MKTTIANTTTHYQQIGKGYPLVLLHGWGCDWQIWGNLIPSLTEHYQLVLPDLPVFGQSDIHDQVWDSFTYAQWLDSLLQEIVGDQPFILGGHSFGGKIAAIYAAQHAGENLEGLVIIDASGLPEKLTQKEALTQSAAQLVPRGIKNVVGNTLKKTILKKLDVATDYQQATELQKAILRKIVREDITHQLSQIDTPCIVIWGEDDQITPLEKGELFAELMQNARLAVIDDAGHYPFLDNQVAFTTTLASFITDVATKTK